MPVKEEIPAEDTSAEMRDTGRRVKKEIPAEDSRAETKDTGRRGTIVKTTFGLLFLGLAITYTMMAEDTPYQKFINQHYKLGMAKRDCKSKMNFINHRYYNNRCKDLNSVIAGPNTDAINAVCDKAGEPYPKKGRVLRKSLQQFRVITCTHMGGSDRPPCDYRASDSMRFIVIACEDKLAVHYEEGKIN
ncbi:hypothetical protein SKAU_G00367870 [Synaphobranchus kaupii]|uniref:Ribonuclease A-domain domain-containing protein n=1 Tax=Synaphobranchus kaupii TaxID=118154 RepID=A0A9Q1EFH4_SYNKA|nr:hypothetical protein SKAU_G00367870 [Synaphobranchus kaupii]